MFAITLAAILVVALGILAFRYDQPMKIEPNPNWELTIASLGVNRVHIFIPGGGINLEADLLIPVVGRELKPAVVTAGGSGQWIYQAYAEDFVEEYILGVFLPRDMAVLLINKRGLGES